MTTRARSCTWRCIRRLPPYRHHRTPHPIRRRYWRLPSCLALCLFPSRPKLFFHPRTCRHCIRSHALSRLVHTTFHALATYGTEVPDLPELKSATETAYMPKVVQEQFTAFAVAETARHSFDVQFLAAGCHRTHSLSKSGRYQYSQSTNLGRRMFVRMNEFGTTIV